VTSPRLLHRSTLLDRLGALAGAFAVVTTVVGTTLADPAPRPNATPSAAAELLALDLADNADAARAGAWWLLLGVFLFLVFVARFQGAVRRAFPDGWLHAAVGVAGAALVAVQLVSVAFAFAASEPDAYVNDPQVAKLILLVGWNGASLLAPSLALLLLVGTAAALGSAELPSWLGWVGLVLLAGLVTAAALGVAGLAAMPGYLFVALVSLVLTVGRQRSEDSQGNTTSSVGNASTATASA
jgi:hypothetical protein